MDIHDFRSILERSGVDIWTFINIAIVVASMDFGNELKQRRDKIIEMLYTSSLSSSKCKNCGFDVYGIDNDEHNVKENNHLGSKEGNGEGESPLTTRRSIHGDENINIEDDDDKEDPYAGLFDEEHKKILEIKGHLEDPDQSEGSLVELLGSLADTNITFKALKESDIGRNVNKLRKHSSNEVRRLVKHLVRKWKEIVDEWVKLNPQGDHASSTLIADGDSPQEKFFQNSHHQVPDFVYSPSCHNGSSSSDKNNSEHEEKPKPVCRKEVAPRPTQQRSKQQQRENNVDFNRLDSARKRLQANYKEVENAKRQRTIQVMDIHEIPKSKNKNTFFAKSKGCGSQRRH